MKWYFETHPQLYTHFCAFHGLDVDEEDTLCEFLRVVGTQCIFTLECLPPLKETETQVWFWIPEGVVVRYSPSATLMDLYSRW